MKLLSQAVGRLIRRSESQPEEQPEEQSGQQDKPQSAAAQVSKKWQEFKQARKRRRCPIVYMPVDVILLIADQLPQHSQLALALTCRPLRAVLCHVTWARISPPERLAFLVCYAAKMPMHWVCETCVRLHRAQADDRPMTSRRLDGSCCWSSPSIELGQGADIFKIHHGQVQIALKNTRMGSGEPFSRHGRKLLQPLEQKNYGSRTSARPVWFSVRPQIFTGRFLLYTVFRFRGAGESISPEELGSFSLCQHLSFSPELISQPSERLSELQNNLVEAIRNGLRLSFAQVRSACTRCPLDYSVTMHKGQLTLEAWRDLGPKGSPAAAAWRAHVSDSKDDEVSHETDSIWRLYERGLLVKQRQSPCWKDSCWDDQPRSGSRSGDGTEDAMVALMNCHIALY